MERIPFETPVSIRIGPAGTIRTVKSVAGACECMTDWPHARRGSVYQATVELLEAAIKGKASAGEARAAFEAFAEHAGALA